MKTKLFLLVLALLTLNGLYAQNEMKQPDIRKGLSTFKHVRKQDLRDKPKKTQASDLLKASAATKQRMDSVIVSGLLKYTYAYDRNGNLTIEADYEWNGETNTWDGDSKYEYAYNSNRNRTMETYYNWDSTANTWVESYKSEFSYDSNGNQTLGTSYYWDSVSNAWLITSKEESSYDSNGNETMYVSYDWDSTSNVWVESYKYESSYDSNGNMTLDIDYEWDDASNTWVESYKSEYAFDSNNNQIMYAVYEWDSETNMWVGDMKQELSYDLSVTIDNIISSEMGFYNKPIRGKIYSWSSNDWQEAGTYEFYYSEVSTGIPDVSNSLNEAIPYRTENNTVVIEQAALGASVRVYSLSGVLLQPAIAWKLHCRNRKSISYR